MTKTGFRAALAWIFMILASNLDAHAQEIGTVKYVGGWAYGTAPQSDREDLFVADDVVADEIVETVRGGAAHITFLDQTELRMGSESKVTLDSLVYNASTGDELVADLSAGVFRIITGAVAKEGIRITTPVAVIGVRGTDFLLMILIDGTTILEVIRGIVTVTPRDGGEGSSFGATQSATIGTNGSIAAGGSVPREGLEEPQQEKNDPSERKESDDSGD